MAVQMVLVLWHRLMLQIFDLIQLFALFCLVWTGCYLCQGGYVFVVVCLLATVRKSFRYEIFREGWQWASEQMVKFWWRSGSWIRIRVWIHIATLVSCALVEVCTVPVLLVCEMKSLTYAVRLLHVFVYCGYLGTGGHQLCHSQRPEVQPGNTDVPPMARQSASVRTQLWQ